MREHFENDCHDCKRGNIENSRAGEEQAQGGGHRAKVRSDIYRVGDQEEADQRIEHRGRIVTAHVFGEAMPGDPSDLGADHLDRAHQRIGEQERPAERIAKLRPGLRISGDATRIVVRGTGNQARTQNVAESRFIGLFYCHRRP